MGGGKGSEKVTGEEGVIVKAASVEGAASATSIEARASFSIAADGEGRLEPQAVRRGGPVRCSVWVGGLGGALGGDLGGTAVVVVVCWWWWGGWRRSLGGGDQSPPARPKPTPQTA